MGSEVPDVIVLDRRIAPEELRRLVERFFGDMVKYVEFTSLINIRPAQANRSMEVEDPALRPTIREITVRILGQGEPLA